MTKEDYEKLLKELMQVFSISKPTIPARIMNKSVTDLASSYGIAYKALYQEVLTEMIANFGVDSTPSIKSKQALLKLIDERMESLNRVTAKQVRKEVEKQYITGSAFGAISAGLATTLKDLKEVVPYSELNTAKIDQLLQDTMEDLLFSTQHTAKNVKKVVRETFVKNLQYHGLKNESQKNIRKIIGKELSRKFMSESLQKKGFVGIVDSAGRKWNTQTYVNMATATKLNQAYTEGLKAQALNSGYDLAVIPEKGATDACKYFEGMIISLTGQTEGYMTYDQLRATGLIFHPRCRHSPCPIGNIDLLPEEDIKFHKEQMEKLKEAKLGKKLK